MAPSLRTLVLSSCELRSFLPWMVAGLPGLENLDISNNLIKVMPVLSVLSVCRIRLIELSPNPFDCEEFCENSETKKYMDNNKQITLAGNLSFCPVVRDGCKVGNITEDQETVRQKCLLQGLEINYLVFYFLFNIVNIVCSQQSPFQIFFAVVCRNSKAFGGQAALFQEDSVALHWCGVRRLGGSLFSCSYF